VLAGSNTRYSAPSSDERYRVHVVPITRGGALVGALEVGQSEGDVTDTLDALLIIIAIAFPLTLLLASFGGLFLARRALAPIDHVTRLAQRVTAEDLSQRLNLTLPDDEVGRLARTFDDMIARLDDAFTRQRRFTADASHELRTPLTAVKGQVDVALSRERPAADYRQTLQEVNAEVDRLIRLVGSLLTLARADAGQIPLTRESIDLGQLAGAAAEQVEPLAREQGVTLAVTDGEPAQVWADEDLLLQLALNLLDNAVKHTPAGGAIDVGWRVNAERVELWVRDSGAGIAAEHLPRVFDRFYRVDEARGRAAGGTGLGLAIARWIAEAHGGTLTAASKVGEGAMFTLTLPAGSPRSRRVAASSAVNRQFIHDGDSGP
jgi:heavy metal sensor kinase